MFFLPTYGRTPCSCGAPAQAIGCEECLFANVENTTDRAVLYIRWTRDGVSAEDVFDWIPGELSQIVCATNIDPDLENSYAITVNGDSLNVTFTFQSQEPIVEESDVETLDPELFNVTDTVYLENCIVNIIHYEYSDDEVIECNNVERVSGRNKFREFTYPLGSGDNITIDFQAYGRLDTLIVIAGGDVVFKEAIGKRSGHTFPNDHVWDNGDIRPFSGTSPVFIGGGFVRVILDLEDNCNLKVIAKSGSKRRTVWRLFVHCCPQCYHPPVKVFTIDTTICPGEQVLDQTFWEDGRVDESSLTRSGCDSLTVYNVTVSQPVIASFITHEPSCFGFADGSIIPEVSAESPTYRWSNGQTTEIATGLAAGNHNLTVTDEYGCTTTKSVTLGEPPLLVADLSVIEPRCYGESNGQLKAHPTGGTPGYRYRWSTGATTAVIDSLPTGDYSVTINDANNCIEILDYFLDQPDSLTVDPINYPETCPKSGDGRVEADVKGGTYPYSYRWQDETTAPELEELSIGYYWVTVTDEYGCVDSTRTFLPNEYQNQVYVPNALAPNGSNRINRVFFPQSGPCVEEVMIFEVFDRWGKQVYAATGILPNDSSVGWDGLFPNGKEAQGIFVWMMKIRYLSGDEEVLRGEVHVIR